MCSVIAAPPTFLDEQVGPAYPPAGGPFIRTGIFGWNISGNGSGFGGAGGGQGRVFGLGGRSARVTRPVEPTAWGYWLGSPPGTSWPGGPPSGGWPDGRVADLGSWADH